MANIKTGGWCRASSRDGPDVIFFSLGLWHMLHITSVESFGRHLVALQKAADAFAALKQDQQVLLLHLNTTKRRDLLQQHVRTCNVKLCVVPSQDGRMFTGRWQCRW